MKVYDYYIRRNRRVRQELSDFKPVEMEVTKSMKQESRYFSNGRFKGYNSDQSFERYFKKIMGITPTEFRVGKLN